MKQSATTNYPSDEVIYKLLKSSNTEDVGIGVSYMYERFKHITDFRILQEQIHGFLYKIVPNVDVDIYIGMVNIDTIKGFDFAVYPGGSLPGNKTVIRL